MREEPRTRTSRAKGHPTEQGASCLVSFRGILVTLMATPRPRATQRAVIQTLSNYDGSLRVR